MRRYRAGLLVLCWMTLICSQASALLWIIPVNQLRGFDPVPNIVDSPYSHEHNSIDPSQSPIYGIRVNSCSYYYYQGDTKALNAFLTRIAETLAKPEEIGSYERFSARVVIHAGIGYVEKSIAPKDGVPLRADWKLDIIPELTVVEVRPQSILHDRVTKLFHKKSITVHVWIDEQQRLELLDVPAVFEVESAGEIEKFVEKSRARPAVAPALPEY